MRLIEAITIIININIKFYLADLVCTPATESKKTNLLHRHYQPRFKTVILQCVRGNIIMVRTQLSLHDAMKYPLYTLISSCLFCDSTALRYSEIYFFIP